VFWGATQVPYLQVLPICEANLRGIGRALSMYQETHHAYPARLQHLALQRYSLGH
jgi:hypothetical protein